jgi:glycosyltransferase involved in cell wall biosynthesis
MRISVIIPTYNAAAYIERAIQSVLAQSRPADEIIVVDDGSSDNTADILKKYQNQIISIRQPNAGVSAARNTGIRAATGDWIAFLDADDEWLPEKLRLQSDLLLRNPNLCWVTGNFLFCRCRQNHLQSPAISPQQHAAVRQQLNGKEYFESYFQAYQFRAAGNTDTMMVRKDKLLEAGLFPEGQKIAEDEDLWFRLAYLDLKPGMALEPLAIYHIHIPDSATKTVNSSENIDSFLSRHRVLAQKAGKTELFKTYAPFILGHWIYKLLLAGKGKEVQRLVGQYGDLMTRYGQLTSYLGSLCPALWRWNEKRKHPELR